MKPPPLLAARTTRAIFTMTSILAPNSRRVCDFRPRGVRVSASMTAGGSKVGNSTHSPSLSPASTSETESNSGPAPGLPGMLRIVEEGIEKAVYRCRFFAILAVSGSLVGSLLCFIKGCAFVAASFQQYVVNRSGQERPKWLEIKTVNGLKTKLGHVIVMLLLIGLLDKSKKAAIHTPLDLLCFSASVLLSSGCLYLLSKLNGSN